MIICPGCKRKYVRLRQDRCVFCRRQTGKQQACEQCGKVFYVSAWELRQTRQGPRRFCSRRCKHMAQRGKEIRPGGRYVNQQGYVMVKIGVRTFRSEHRLLMEKELGRDLTANEHVHHINGNRQDNRLENLIVLTNSEHQKLHGQHRIAVRN